MKTLPILAALAATATTAEADTPKQRVDQAIHDYKAAGNAFTGAVVVVIDHGNAYKLFYGTRDLLNPFDTSTAIQIGSNTKTFTGTALAWANYYNIIDKDSKLSDWLSISAASPAKDATLMQLADHHSGLPRGSGDPTPPGLPGPYATPDGLFASLSYCYLWQGKDAACVAPGPPLYSNYAYQVIGNLVAREVGYPTWSPMNHDVITEPLGMTHTCLHGDGCNPDFNTNHAQPFAANGLPVALPPRDVVAAPAGGLWTTATDMATWLRYNLGEPTTAQSGTLDALRPSLRTHPAGSSTGFGWNFKQLTFSDGVTTNTRWKMGRWQGLVSYMGIADNRDTAVFVFVNQDPIPSTSDPNDDGPGAPVHDLGDTILEQFP